MSRASEADINAAWDAVKLAVNPRIHTFIATSDIHMQYKLKMSRDEVGGGRHKGRIPCGNPDTQCGIFR